MIFTIEFEIQELSNHRSIFLVLLDVSEEDFNRITDINHLSILMACLEWDSDFFDKEKRDFEVEFNLYVYWTNQCFPSLLAIYYE